MMLLSPETLEGLRMTGNYNFYTTCMLHIPIHFFFYYVVKAVVELVRFLLSLPGVKYVLTEKFCQDPLESFFGQQWAQGRRNDNPTEAEFTTNTNSIRVQSSIATDPLHGNCRIRPKDKIEIDKTPLLKRRRHTKK